MATAARVQDYVRLTALMNAGRVREHNEDNFIVCPDLGKTDWYVDEKPIPLSPLGCLLVVADGMGGANAGEVASEIGVECIKHYFLSLSLQEQPSERQAKEYLNKAICLAHETIAAHANSHSECEGMGTTIVLAWVFKGKAVLAWCGDSRGYLYRPGESIRIVTRDHSLVWELVEAGQLSPDEADFHPKSNFITQNLGNPQNPPKPDVTVVSLQAFDRLLLCSDGLNNMLTSPAIEKIVGQPKKSLDAVSRELVESANENGGKDNITVVMLEVMEQPLAPQPKLYPRKMFSIALVALAALLLLAAGWWLGNRGKQAQPVALAAEPEPAVSARAPGARAGTIVKGEPPGEKQEPARRPPKSRPNIPEPKKGTAEISPAAPAPDVRWDTLLNRVAVVVMQRDKIVIPDEAPGQQEVEDTVKSYFEAGLEKKDSLIAGPQDKQTLLNQLDVLLDERNFREWAKKWSTGSHKDEVRKQVTAKWAKPGDFEAEIKKAEELLASISKSKV